MDRVWPIPEGGPWAERANAALEVAYRSFQKSVQDNHLSCSHPGFSVNSLGMSTLQSPAYLKGNAANTLHICSWLYGIASAHARRHPDDSHSIVRAGALWGFVRTFEVCLGGEQWLNSKESPCFG